MQPGRQTVPALAFSFFNPDTRRYETKLTAPVERGGVHWLPLAAWPRPLPPLSNASPIPASEPPRDGLRPDHVETGSTVATLRPLYFQTVVCRQSERVGSWFRRRFDLPAPP